MLNNMHIMLKCNVSIILCVPVQIYTSICVFVKLYQAFKVQTQNCLIHIWSTLWSMDNMPKQHITQTILEAGRLKNFFSFNFYLNSFFRVNRGIFYIFPIIIHTCFVNIDMLTNHTKLPMHRHVC